MRPPHVTPYLPLVPCSPHQTLRFNEEWSSADASARIFLSSHQMSGQTIRTLATSLCRFYMLIKLSRVLLITVYPDISTVDVMRM